MKLDSLEIVKMNHRPLMNGLNMNFPKNGKGFINTNCFIGINGSGKSQVLESIAEIFLFVDRCYRRINRRASPMVPAIFRINYSIWKDGEQFSVTISNIESKKHLPEITIKNLYGEVLSLEENQVEQFLPSKIIGYTSGDNETLSTPFLSYYDVYAEFVAKRAFGEEDEKDYEPRFYFMDYNTNLGIAISNMVFDTDLTNEDPENGLSQIKNELNIDRLRSFQLIIQTNQSAAPKIKSPSGETGILLTPELKSWLDYLKRSATCYDYVPKENRYVFDFHMGTASKDALMYFFKSSYRLYTALYKFEILNNLIVDKTTRTNIEKERSKRNLTVKMPQVPDKDKVMRYSELKLKLSNSQMVDYLSLSDGEHQYFNVFGTVLMINDQNALFLLDEPETHFNPKWRRVFISNLNALTRTREQDLFLTSHSPFIISDTAKEYVHIFKRVNKDKIEIEYPRLETFGASFNHILQMAFDLSDSMSEDSSQFIEKLLKSKDVKEIEEGISKLGDSPKIMALFRRLELLKKDNK